MSDYAPTNEGELHTLVRGITDYDETDLSPSRLKTLTRVAKMTLQNEAGSDKWYTDSGLGQALTFTLCIRAKESVENYSITSWSIGNETIDVSGVGDGDQQFTQWNSLAHDGLVNSDVASVTPTPNNTASYIG